jgi:hypothetical protein
MSHFPEHFERQCQLHLKHLKLKGLQPRTIAAYARGMRRIGKYRSYQLRAFSRDQVVEYFTELIASHSWRGVKLDLYALKFFAEHVLRKPWSMPNFTGQRYPQARSILDLSASLCRWRPRCLGGAVADVDDSYSSIVGHVDLNLCRLCVRDAATTVRTLRGTKDKLSARPDLARDQAVEVAPLWADGIRNPVVFFGAAGGPE